MDLTQLSCEDFLSQLASKAPAPGGGGAGSNGVAEAHQTSSENISVSQASLTARDTQPAPGGRGSDGGEAGDGCIIIYYRKKKELQSGPLVTSNNLGLLDSLGRRMIV